MFVHICGVMDKIPGCVCGEIDCDSESHRTLIRVEAFKDIRKRLLSYGVIPSNPVLWLAGQVVSVFEECHLAFSRCSCSAPNRKLPREIEGEPKLFRPEGLIEFEEIQEALSSVVGCKKWKPIEYDHLPLIFDEGKWPEGEENCFGIEPILATRIKRGVLRKLSYWVSQGIEPENVVA